MATRKRIGLRQVRALKPGETIFDEALPGFGARRQKGDAVSYVLFYRNQTGRQRWHTIGRHGAPWTPDDARDEAKRLLGEVVDGGDPVAEKMAKRNAATVAELCDLYLADAEAGRVLKRSGVPKKVTTLSVDKGRIERHIKPLIGRLAVASVTREDIERLLHDIADGKSKAKIKTKPRGLAVIKGGKTAANRVVGLLGAIFTYAVRRHMRVDNPVHGSQRFADALRERRLSDDEYKALGKALEMAGKKKAPQAKAKDAKKGAEQQIWPAAVAAARFLALTGWRRGEALGLRWTEVDLARRTATLGDTKTGRSLRPLSNAACDVLRTLTRSDDDALVFQATRGDGPMAGFRKFWMKIAKLGELPSDITPHTLRHSFASLAGDLGYSEPTIAALVGHQGRSVTSRYIHAADAVLLAAADAVADRTAALMAGVVTQLRQAAG
jgi:integrase